MNVNRLEQQSLRAQESATVEKIEFDSKQNDKNVDKEKKSKSNKSTAVSLIDREMDPDEFLQNRIDKQLKKNSKNNEALNKQFKSKMDKSIKDMFAQETKVDSQDQAILSQHYGDMTKKKVKQERSETSKSVSEGKLVDDPESTIQGYGKKYVQPKDGKKPVKGTQRQLNNPHSPKVLAETQTVLQKYMSAYSEALIDGTPQKKKEVAQLRQKLEQLPVSIKKLKTLESRVNQMMKGDLKKQLKKSFIDFALTFNPKKMGADNIIYEGKFSQMTALAQEMGVFEGEAELKEIKNESKRELKQFVSYELDSALTASKLKGGDMIKEIIKAFDRFSSIAGISGFNSATYLKDFNKKLEDFGLNEFKRPDKTGILDVESEPDFKDGQRKNDSDKRESSENPELVEDQLRTLYMQKIIKQGIAQTIKLNLKIIKLKKTMKSLGTYNEKKIKKIQEEGKALARYRLSDLLREAFEERATLPKLEGTAFVLVRKKIKMSLKGFRLIGEPMEKKNIEAIRDKINQAIFGIIKQEYNKILIHLEGSPDEVSLIRKEKEYRGILERLNEESKLGQDLKQKMFSDVTLSSDMNIVEAA
ncbi:hypothetical protein HOH45_08705 [bacterium]|jgi:hypothetical protein|nr:hypothetical protein [bacterium]